MNNKMTPCFYCEEPAKYTGPVESVNDHLEVVEVCENHFVFPGTA